ncbi:hypothetical protein MGSAQ_001377 [marine sediment metagenome]|uniref:Uncharacterized protein n=1 Tax=marine sediment metagenome TaxID=412755 RepID=A0A1B6NUU9_9ZZZZ
MTVYTLTVVILRKCVIVQQICLCKSKWMLRTDELPERDKDSLVARFLVTPIPL